ncbi:YopX family protein, partial [Bifidobacterium catenulatum]
ENAEGTFGVELFSETNQNEAIGNIFENPELLEANDE